MGIAGALLCTLVAMGVCTTPWRGLKSAHSLRPVPDVLDPAGNVEDFAGQGGEPPELSGRRRINTGTVA
jgi:hypothetical protein